MDVNAYIESEILEQYVLGSVTPQEQQEVECMSKIYPEIKEKLVSYQSAIESMALKMAVSAPERVKQNILKEIKNISQTSNSDDKMETKVVAMQPERKSDKSNYTMLVAACLVGLILTAAFAAFKTNQNAALKDQIALQQAEIDASAKNYIEMETLAALNQDQLAFIKQANTTRIKLGPTATNEGSEAQVFWNKESQKVVLDMALLPALPADKEYQLWAIIDGVPQDMGMVDMDSKTKMVEMKTTDKAQAFAITVEPKGGSKVPTLEAMVVVGAV